MLSHLVQSGGAGQPVSDQTLGYNPANQLAQLIQVSSNFVWHGQPATTTQYTFDGLNRDASIAALTGGFDGNGNLTFDGARTMTYSAENRLLHVASGATAAMSATYDPTGRLVSTVETPAAGGTTNTWFLYDGDCRPCAQVMRECERPSPRLPVNLQCRAVGYLDFCVRGSRQGPGAS